MIALPIAGLEGPAGLFARYMAVLLGFCGLIASAFGGIGIFAMFRTFSHGIGAAALLEERDARLSSIATTVTGVCLLGAATLVLCRIGI